jgi:hypothetical protein
MIYAEAPELSLALLVISSDANRPHSTRENARGASRANIAKLLDPLRKP